MSPIETCRAIVDQWERLAVHASLIGSIFKTLPVHDEIPALPAVRGMRRIIYEVVRHFEGVEDGVVQIVSGNHRDVYLFVFDEDRRFVAHVIWDGTVDMRYYLRGQFRHGVVLWPDGSQTDMLEEIAEII